MHCLTRYRPLTIVQLAALVLFAAGCGGGAGESTTTGESARLDHTPADQPPGELQLEVSQDRVSLRAHNVALGRLLRELAAKGGLTLVSQSPLTDRMTLHFDGLSLDDAIRRILHNRNYTLGYAVSSQSAGGSRPSVLFVVAQGAEIPTDDASAPLGERGLLIDRITQLSVRPDDVDERQRILAYAISHADAGVRMETVELLGEVTDPDAIGLLELALSDSQDAIREAAVEALGAIGGEAAAAALTPALSDPDPVVREEAVDALGAIGGPVATNLLRQALLDNDEGVRETAAELLNE